MATYQEWSQVIAKAWLDEEFKSLLERDPAAALKQQCGIDTDITFPVPPRPEGLSDEQLNAIAADGNTPFIILCPLCC